MSKKNSHDNFGNQTRDLPTCSVVPQPSVPPRTPPRLHQMPEMPSVVPYMYIPSTSVKCLHSSNEILCGKKTTLWIFFFFYVKGLRSANSSIQEYCNFKRKGSPLIENCQPTKFISLAEAVCRFQTNTPDRFHSRPKTGKKRLCN